MGDHHHAPRRVSVVGNSGSGKTTLARELAKRLGVPYIEMDAIHHQRGWEPMPADRIVETLERHVQAPGWVIDGNYQRFVMEGPVWRQADTVVWLDLPRRTVMRQVVGRTLRRLVTREELWNGNREPFSNILSVDPERSVIAWAWTRDRDYRERYVRAMADPRWRHLRFVRLRSRREARRYLEAVATS